MVQIGGHTYSQPITCKTVLYDFWQHLTNMSEIICTMMIAQVASLKVFLHRTLLAFWMTQFTIQDCLLLPTHYRTFSTSGSYLLKDASTLFPVTVPTKNAPWRATAENGFPPFSPCDLQLQFTPSLPVIWHIVIRWRHSITLISPR